MGERGKEVRDFIERDLGEAGLKRSVVIVATSDQPALVRIKAAYVATRIAEIGHRTAIDHRLAAKSLHGAQNLRRGGVVPAISIQARAEIVDDDSRAARDQGQDDPSADPSSAAGDESDFSVQQPHATSPFMQQIDVPRKAANRYTGQPETRPSRT